LEYAGDVSEVFTACIIREMNKPGAEVQLNFL
jgi:hypothetical protein